MSLPHQMQIPTPRSRHVTPNIVVFGRTGAGKSSLISMMARKEITTLSSQATGCTPSIQKYSIQSDAGDTYTIWDTPGLCEWEEGNVPVQEAFKHLYHLVEQCDINLIVYCIRGSRLMDIARVNYDLFYGIMCEGMVPIVLVVTGLELGNDMDQWWNSNKKVVEQMGMTFEGYACVATTKGRDDIYEEKFRVSEGRVWALLKDHCDPIPWTPRQGWLAEVPNRMDAYMKAYNSRTGKEKKVLPMLDHRAQKSKSTSDPSICASSPIKHNVILFGESGSGKSSLVNMIVGHDVAKVSSSPMGCTFKNECYETRLGDISYRIYDTVGLNEGDHGRVPHWKAIQGLYTLIRQLDGVSLLIFCMQGRIKDNARSNWLFFFDAICGQKVPIIAVVTGWEHEENLEEAEKRVRIALKTYSMVPKEVACVVSIWGKNNEHAEKYKRSQQRLRSLIVKCRREEPWSMEKNQWFAQLYQRTYELRICTFVKSGLQFVEEIQGVLEEFKKNSNLTKGDIDTLTKGVFQAEKRILKKRIRHGLD